MREDVVASGLFRRVYFCEGGDVVGLCKIEVGGRLEEGEVAGQFGVIGQQLDAKVPSRQRPIGLPRLAAAEISPGVRKVCYLHLPVVSQRSTTGYYLASLRDANTKRTFTKTARGDVFRGSLLDAGAGGEDGVFHAVDDFFVGGADGRQDAP